MLRYLIYKNMLYETYRVDEIDKSDLIALAKGETDEIFDVLDGKYFDAKKNEWVQIPIGKEVRP